MSPGLSDGYGCRDQVESFREHGLSFFLRQCLMGTVQSTSKCSHDFTSPPTSKSSQMLYDFPMILESSLSREREWPLTVVMANDDENLFRSFLSILLFSLVKCPSSLAILKNHLIEVYFAYYKINLF